MNVLARKIGNNILEKNATKLEEGHVSLEENINALKLIGDERKRYEKKSSDCFCLSYCFR